MFFDLEIALVTNLILPFVDHPNAQTRAQVLRTLDEMGVANSTSIDFLFRSYRPEMTGQGMGGQYKRRFERYLARKTLEK